MSAAHVFLKTELVVRSYKIVCKPIKNSMFEHFRHHKTNGYSTKIIKLSGTHPWVTNTASRGNNFVGGICAPSSALLVHSSKFGTFCATVYTHTLKKEAFDSRIYEVQNNSI